MEKQREKRSGVAINKLWGERATGLKASLCVSGSQAGRIKSTRGVSLSHAKKRGKTNQKCAGRAHFTVVTGSDWLDGGPMAIDGSSKMPDEVQLSKHLELHQPDLFLFPEVAYFVRTFERWIVSATVGFAVVVSRC
jgi:hypothetical protein